MTLNLTEDYDFRFERKYHISDLPTAEIESLIFRCPAFFREAFPPRHINNIYLDNFSLGNYFQNMDGVANRTKIRIRWYGDLFGKIARPVLEYKIKRGMLGTKDAHPLMPFEIGKGFCEDDLKRLFAQSDLDHTIMNELEFVAPTLLNRYHRRYFISIDRAYRVTLDSQLEFYKIEASHNRFLVHRLLEGSSVLELKYSGSISKIDENLMNFFPFRVTRMSKYIVGIELVTL